MKLTRRTLMISAGSAALIAAAAGGWAAAGRRVDFVAAMVRRLFPDAPLTPDAPMLFAEAFLQTRGDEELGKVDALVKAWRLVGQEGLEAMFGDNRSFEHFRRRVGTQFLIGSNFFQRLSDEEPVRFVGLAYGCTNPFAQFND